LLLVLAGALAAGAAARTSGDPGVTPQTIVLGATAPLSGPESAAVRGAGAYFRYLNTRGGVNGRSIAYKVVDDASDPAQALQATEQLVDEDAVFAIVNAAGTEQNLAMRDYLNGAKVPQLFVGSGATTFGADYRRYPWTIGFRPSNHAEGEIYGSYLSRARPGAKIAVLHQSDVSGTELLAGLRQGLGRSKARVVVAQPVDATLPDVQAAQIASLKATGATVLALFVAQPQAAQGYALASRVGWRPLIVTAAGSTVEGAVSITFLEDPSHAGWRSDTAMKLYRTIMAKYARGASPRDVNHVYGMAVAYETVKLLKAAGKTPTRAAVAAQMQKLNDVSNPFLLPGIAVKTSATERFPVEQALLQRWSKGSWKSFGGLWG
jgi:branched-chain amino acid transport system substrate-binding protein